MLFFKKVRAGRPKNLIEIAIIKKRIPLPNKDIIKKANRLTSLIPLVNVMIL